MAKHGLGIITIVFLLVCLCGLGLGQTFVFTDPTELYSTTIADQWVYQAHHSTPALMVFYGEGDFDLLYVETLEKVFDTSVQSFAERSLQLYQEPGGLKDFVLESPLEPVNIGGRWGLSCAYTYLDGRANKLWEQRVFALLPGNRGLSLALGSDGNLVTDGAVLQDMIEYWRWLF